MATIVSVGLLVNGTGNLCTAQTGNGATTNIIDRGLKLGLCTGPALLRIVTTVGATPTCTYLVEGSANGTDWSPAIIADSATPTTLSFATFVITSATTVLKLIQANQPFRFFRMTLSSNTNVTSTADLWTF
jgi:hypothetical protein